MKEKKIKQKPEVYRLSYRHKMGADAQTQELTSESPLHETFTDKKSAVSWITTNGRKDLVYIIRNRKQVQIASYCWKPYNKSWGPISHANYHGGYKIGNPCTNNCNCCRRPVNQPVHPTINGPSSP